MSAEKRQLIQNLFLENVSQHKIHNTILADLETVLTDEFCYITELLQNANDAGAQHFSMHYQDGYLIYTNDGEPFKEDHVLRICNYSGAHQAQQTPQKLSEDKVINIEKIGHKDVGFKTVFKFANGVYIRSGGYSFRFDEQYGWQQHSSNPVPWMITPIWTELAEYPNSVLPYLLDNKTHFVFSVKSEFLSKLAAAVRSIQNNMSTLLFLDKIESFNFSGYLDLDNLQVHIQRTLQGNNVVLKDIVNNKQEKWVIKSYSKDLTPDVKKELMQMSEFSCPDKVKSKQDVTVTFAIECSEQMKIIANTDKSRLYTHLPTKQKCLLPYHVSAVFLLDKSRQSILTNSYNNFIFYAIGYLQFEFAKDIASSRQIADQVLNMLGFDFDMPDEQHKLSYLNGFRDAARAVPFLLPFKEDAEKITLCGASIDSTKTLYKFPLEHALSHNLIHPAIKNKKRILVNKYGYEIDIHTISDLIEKNLRNSKSLPSYYTTLITHLFHLAKDFKNRQLLMSYLKQKEIFYAQDQRFYKAEHLFIPSSLTEKLDTAIGLPRFNIAVHEDVVKAIPKEELNAWLSSCGLKASNFHNVIQGHLSKRIKEVSDSKEFHAGVIKYLYIAYSEEIDLRDYPELQHITLITTGSDFKKPANLCLFSTSYQPDADLEKEIKADIFLSPVYLALDQKSPERVKQFFQSLGVVSAIEFHEVDISVAEFRQKYPSIALDYENFIPNEAVKRVNEENRFLKFSYIDHIQLLGNLSYQRLFFQVFVNRWRSIKQAEASAMLQNSRTKTPIKAFIHYYLVYHAHFVTCDGQCLSASKTYHPRFAIFKDKQLPVIDTGVELSHEQVSFLGTQNYLSIDHIFRLFTDLCKSELDDIILEKYKLIFKLIIEYDYSEEELARLRFSKIFLPASDQTYQPLGDLNCFDAYEESVPFNNKWLKQIDGISREEMNLLSEKLNIPVVKQINVEFIFHQLWEEPLVKIKDILPLFAIYLSKNTAKKPNDYLKEWAEKVAGLKIYFANEILDVHDKEHKISVHYDARLNQLTYTDRWNRGESCRQIANRVAVKILKQKHKYADELKDLISYDDKEVINWKRRKKVSQQDYFELDKFWRSELDQQQKKILEQQAQAVRTLPSLKIKIKVPLKRELSLKDQELAQLFSGQIEAAPVPALQTENHALENLPLKRSKKESDHEVVSKAAESTDKRSDSVNQTPARYGLFSHENKNSREIKVLFENSIPEGFGLAAAKGKGDCFYDSCAQELNEWAGKNEYSIKSLRVLCNEYAVELDRICNANLRHPDNWIAKAFNYDSRKYQEYLANVRYSVEEREAEEGLGDDKLAVWGEQHIDGRILCKQLGIKLHVIEVRENPDDLTNKTEKFIVSHNLVDEAGLKNVDGDNIDWNDRKLIHIAVCNIHFVPILRNIEQLNSPVITQSQLPPEPQEINLSSSPKTFQNKLILKMSTQTADRDDTTTGSQTPIEKKKANKKDKKSAEKKRMSSFEPALNISQLLNFTSQLSNVIEQTVILDLQESEQATQAKKRKTGNMAAVNAMKESQVDQKTRDSIGLHGEAICYRRLYEHYLKKYQLRLGEVNVQEHTLGFSISTKDGGSLVKVDWHDKVHAQDPRVQKSTTDHDFLITKPQSKKYIEVKSTVEYEKRSFTLSGGELLAMNRYGERYRFFRVLGVMSDAPKIEVLKNPRKLLEEEKISAEIKSIEICYSRK